MNRCFGKWHFIGLGLIAAVLLVNSAIAYRNTRQLHHDAFWVAHTHQALESLDDLVSAVRDAETGRRRILTTGKENLVKPYEDALAALDANVERFKRLTADNDHQQAHISRLQELIQAKRNELAGTLAVRKGPAFEAARQVVLADPAKSRMAEIRGVIAQMYGGEQALLREREQANDRAYRSALVSGAVSALMALAAVTGFIWVLRLQMVGLHARLETHRKLHRLQVELEETNSRLERANDRMSHDLGAAAKIQQTFLPCAAPNIPGTQFGWCHRSYDELAGDGLNIIPLGGGKVGLYILDVSGHGVSAALMLVTFSRLLSPPSEPFSVLTRNRDALDRLDVTPPAEVADRLNRLFPFDTATEQFATLLYGVLDVSTGDFRYVSAGHPGPIHRPAGEPPVILETPGFPIGLAEEAYCERCVHLAAGDRLYLYSDGLTDGMNPGGERFGDARLLDAIGRGGAEPLPDEVNALLGEIARWQGGAKAQDDISILAVELAPAPRPVPTLRPRDATDLPRQLLPPESHSQRVAGVAITKAIGNR
jgi:phosphoserine phosphatase RsbU/P